jgi:hypothetical protein
MSANSSKFCPRHFSGLAASGSLSAKPIPRIRAIGLASTSIRSPVFNRNCCEVPQLASLKLGLPKQLTMTVLFVFGVSRLNSRCLYRLEPVLDLHSLHRQQSHFLRLFDFYSYNASWTYNNGQPADLFFPPYSC